MSNRPDPSLRELDECGCGEGISLQTPVRVDNPPGLSRIDYRVGTYSRFIESMLASIAGAGHRSLGLLRTRAEDDPTVALLHACAAVDDVLTFYQERIAQEAYLRTATERFSLVQLARLLGYQPKPGVAANVHLTFTVETTPGSPESAPIAAGTRVQSIPGPSQLPQTFETSNAIEAHAAWNAIKLRTTRPQPVSTTMAEVIVQGIEVGVKAGDRILLVDPLDTTKRAVKRVKRITPDTVVRTTRIELDVIAPPPPPALASSIPFVWNLARLALDDTTIGSVFAGNVFVQSDVHTYGLIQQWPSYKLALAVNTPKPPPPGPELAGVFALRQRAAIFGHNAPKWDDLPQIVVGSQTLVPGRLITDLSKAQYPTKWDGLTVDQATPATNSVDLDNVYPAMQGPGWVVLEKPGTPLAFEIKSNQELTRTDYTLSVKVTRLGLPDDSVLSGFPMRETSVFGQSDKLPLARLPIADPVSGSEITLDGYYPGLVPGQPIILTGERTDLNGVVESEAAVIKEVLVDGALEVESGRLFTRLIFDTALANSYLLATITVNANAVLATHGETKGEVLGSGNAADAFPTFTLKQPPLTYTSAQTPSGVASSLEVRVDGVRWDEAPFLYGRDEAERVYSVTLEDSGVPRVQFNGRLPTGQENVRATYRQGIGAAGLVHANQVTLLAVRPLGVRGVTNPLPSSGAADPEALDSLRRNLPLAVLTLDRLVSLRDFEDFARAFAGFAKAHAAATVDGERQGIFVTVAGVDGAEVAETSVEFTNLVAAMTGFGDPNLPFLVKPYTPIYFQVEADIAVDPAYTDADVVAAVQSALRLRFAFAAQSFGQSVAKSDVIAVIQNVPGVETVDLNFLFATVAARTLAERLQASVPAPGGSSSAAVPASLLLLDPRPIVIGVLP